MQRDEMKRKRSKTRCQEKPSANETGLAADSLPRRNGGSSVFFQIMNGGLDKSLLNVL